MVRARRRADARIRRRAREGGRPLLVRALRQVVAAGLDARDVPQQGHRDVGRLELLQAGPLRALGRQEARLLAARGVHGDGQRDPGRQAGRRGLGPPHQEGAAVVRGRVAAGAAADSAGRRGPGPRALRGRALQVVPRRLVHRAARQGQGGRRRRVDLRGALDDAPRQEVAARGRRARLPLVAHGEQAGVLGARGGQHARARDARRRPVQKGAPPEESGQRLGLQALLAPPGHVLVRQSRPPHEVAQDALPLVRVAASRRGAGARRVVGDEGHGPRLFMGAAGPPLRRGARQRDAPRRLVLLDADRQGRGGADARHQVGGPTVQLAALVAHGLAGDTGGHGRRVQRRPGVLRRRREVVQDRGALPLQRHRVGPVGPHRRDGRDAAARGRVLQVPDGQRLQAVDLPGRVLPRGVVRELLPARVAAAAQVAAGPGPEEGGREKPAEIRAALRARGQAERRREAARGDDREARRAPRDPRPPRAPREEIRADGRRARGHAQRDRRRRRGPLHHHDQDARVRRAVQGGGGELEDGVGV
mmetsp:Transcript_2530/g.7656  ORF Transcript_2530/g.7656 Transcript_2530/m.7656 type:complete len:534 (-) Transcript_2530:78-1679(-)